MRAADIIDLKRRGQRLTREQIHWFVRGCLTGEVADYQAAAWLMAVAIRGMDVEETWDLTEVMAGSGERLEWPKRWGRVLDKHSTGGVADTATLVVVPLVAALGIPVVKLSGRGLGHTGGTIDKLEAIPGLKTALSPRDIRRVLDEAGMVIASQSASLAPADGHLYALRDVTATVDSIPLIAASIMAKKLAANAAGLVLDVKSGSGAILPGFSEARELAHVLLAMGRRGGLTCRALITCMEQPLGRVVGNAAEVQAAWEVMGGGGPPRLLEVSVALAAELVAMGRGLPMGAAQDLVREGLRRGAAREQFSRWLRAQGAVAAVADDPSQLPRATRETPVIAASAGFVHRVDARRVGMAAVALGAGRQRQGEPIDPGAAVILEVEVGSPVARGDLLARLRYSPGAGVASALAAMGEALTIADRPPATYGPVLEVML